MLKSRTIFDKFGKKKALLARKEQILLDLQYYETRIPEYTTKSTNQYYSSSDSEDDTSFPPFTLEVGPSVSELKQQQQVLRICRQATQELSELAVLQSEVNVLAQDPIIEGERPISEPGTWREVTAECRIDMVPFSITFYTHQPRRKFAPICYRGLKVLPVKEAQEAELAKSVLGSLTRPSDVIEVLRSYASAFRSRRNTFARLADKYTNNLSLERLPEGGFMLKCANLLTMSWTLENKQSAVAAFHHKMSFVLEYMDESHLKKIKPEHRKLADPSLQTDERTLILSKIITICIEAQTQTQDAYESLESDQESVRRLDKTTLSEDIDENEDINRKKTDEEVMAPPKTIPKKAKPKGKENTEDNRKSVKRASETDGQNAKKAKIDTGDGRGKSITDMVKEKDMSAGKNQVKKTADKEQMDQNGDDVVDKEQINQKGDDQVDKEQKKQKVTEKNVDRKQINQKKTDKQVDKRQTVEKSAEKSAKESKVAAKNVEKQKNGDSGDKNNKIINKNHDKKTENVQTQSKVTDKNEKQKSNHVEKATDKVKAKNSENTEKMLNKVDDKGTGSKQARNTKNNAETLAKNTADKNLNSKKVAKSDTNAKNGNNDVPQLKNNVEKDANPKTVAKNTTTKNSQNDKVTEKNRPKSNIEPNTAKTVAQNAKITTTAINTEKANKENKNDNQTTNTKNNKAPTNKPKEKNIAVKAISTTEKIKTLPKNDPKKIFQSKTVDTENKIADPKNKMVEANNKIIDAKNKIGDPKNKMGDLRNKMGDPKNKMVEANNKIFDAKNKIGDPKNKMGDLKNKMGDPKNKMVEANNKIIDAKNKIGDPKNKMGDLKNKMGDPKNKMVAAKNKLKPQLVLPNHRNSGVVNKASVNKESRIPAKKISPYAKVLQKNMLRVSPRIMSKFKSSSDTNIQTKFFRPSTNIPRLMKQTRPESK